MNVNSVPVKRGNGISNDPLCVTVEYQPPCIYNVHTTVLLCGTSKVAETTVYAECMPIIYTKEEVE